MLRTSVKKLADQARLEGKREGMLEGKREGRLEGKREGRLEGKREGRLEGKHEGMLEGKREGRLETARALLKEKMTPDRISKITGISLEEIRRLK